MDYLCLLVKLKVLSLNYWLTKGQLHNDLNIKYNQSMKRSLLKKKEKRKSYVRQQILNGKSCGYMDHNSLIWQLNMDIGI